MIEVLYKPSSHTRTPTSRVFFDQLAMDKGFHPTKDPLEWYTITRNDVLSKLGQGYDILRKFSYSFKTAIVKSYPELRLEERKFDETKVAVSTREFFKKLAAKKYFHPIHHPNKWYKISARDIEAQKGGKSILRRFKLHSVAVMKTFPELMLTEGLFRISQPERIQFFTQLAKDKGFHPTKQPEMWYSIRSKDLHARKV
jgi:hypothetical protein